MKKGGGQVKRIFSNKKLMVILTVVLILSFVLIYFLNCPAYKTSKELKKGNSVEATLQLSQMDNTLQMSLFLLLLPSTMKDINNSYNIGELSFDNVEELYEIVCSFKMIDISKYHNDFKELALSKQSYDNAVLAMNDLDYSTAISHYKNVISADSLYDTAQQELQSTTDKYKNNITDRFYGFVLNGNIDDATKIIDEAVAVVSDDSLNKIKSNLTSGIYDKVCVLLNKSSEWEIITQAHAGENTYCCYRIKLSKNNSNAFECYYVIKSLNSLVQSGNISSIGGPVAWYRLSGEKISKLTYNEKKGIESGGYSGSVSWDYTMSKIEKLKKLEMLLS